MATDQNMYDHPWQLATTEYDYCQAVEKDRVYLADDETRYRHARALFSYVTGILDAALLPTCMYQMMITK